MSVRNLSSYDIVCVAVLLSGLLDQSPLRAETQASPRIDVVAIESIAVAPAPIRIGGANRTQQLLVTARSKSGRFLDVTHHCKVSISDEAVARVHGSVLTGVADGKAELLVTFGPVQTRAEIVVKDFGTYPAVHFSNDVIPLFSKLGCNSAGCHGKQSGQNGFRLSVFGFDPRADYVALVKEARGRRTFPADPQRSLLVAKSIGRVAHGGGRRAEMGSPDHQLLSNWVRQGMPWGDDEAARLISIRIEPANRVMDMQADQQILVTAVYSNGSLRDVTAAASYSSNAETIVEVNETGRLLTGGMPGEAAVTVNYMGQVGAARVLIPRQNAPDPFPEMPVNNRIDVLVAAKLKKMGIVPSGLADDAIFLRRLTVDTIGTLPTSDEVRAFLADSNPDKRQRAIETVLERDEYTDYWSLKWADVLLVDRDKLGERGAFQFHRWLREQVARNRPYDQWVRELLTASGSSGRHGPVNFYRALPNSEDISRAVSQAFLGVRLDCAQCHHHPFEIWAQDDFYGLAGFFNGLQRKPLGGGRELIYHAGYRPTRMPLTGKVVPTHPPGGEVPPNIEDGDPRVRLAEWVTSPENPWFARLAANRLWKHFLGRGLVEPEDDLRSTNPATNEPLLAYLAEQIIAHKFDLKALMRLILNSRVYQLSSEPNDTNFDDEQNYSHFTVKRLPAEVLLDAVCQVTGTPERFPGMPLGTRSIDLWDNRLPSYFLDTFGRSERKTPCECGKSNEPTMAQALHLMNAPEIEAKISDHNGRVAHLIAAQADRDTIIAELTLATLGRLPSEKERQIAERLFASGLARQAAEDFLWTLLNSYDFLFVH